MKLVLAPMAGLTDFYMRDALTRLGHYDWCVTEFVRVTGQLLPNRTFLLACPELHNGARTAAGTPVHMQLLGSDPVALAENAARAVELGAPAIDLNFGCPARVVNRHGGGAILLDEPEVVHNIIATVRRAVPAHIPVSAKMRLGVRDWSRMIDNALGAAAAGAGWLTVHARTKDDGYRPPAHWEAIARIGEHVTLPIIANGEIWNVNDAQRCQQISGCSSLMLGRGAVTRPDLAHRIRGQDITHSWSTLVPYLLRFMDEMMVASHLDVAHHSTYPKHFGNARPVLWSERGSIGRTKQWLARLADGYPEAAAVFTTVKRSTQLDIIRSMLVDSTEHPPTQQVA